MTRVRFLRQRNGYDCGPIACAKILDCFGMWNDPRGPIRKHVVTAFKNLLQDCLGDIFVSPPVIEIDDDEEMAEEDCVICMESVAKVMGTVMECCGHTMHAVCVDKWLCLCPKCPLCRETVKKIVYQGSVIPFGDLDPDSGDEEPSANLQAAGTEALQEGIDGEAPTRVNDAGDDEVKEDSDGDEGSDGDDDSNGDDDDYQDDNDGNEQTPRTTARNKAKEIKRKRQDVQATRMMRRRAFYTKESGAAVGAIVKVCNDKRDIKNPRCTIGVIVEMSSAGGVLVCTELGILVMGITRRNYWVPSDRYEVVMLPEDEHAGLAISPQLNEIRESVLDGSFDKSKAKKCSLSEDQKNFLGTSPVRAGHGCKCRLNGDRTCGRSCSCIRNKRACTSKCLCNGNCSANQYNE